MIEKDFDANTLGGETFLDSPLYEKFIAHDIAVMNQKTLWRLSVNKDHHLDYIVKSTRGPGRLILHIGKCFLEVDDSLEYGEIRWFKDGKEIA